MLLSCGERIKWVGGITMLLRDKACVLWSLREEGQVVHLHGLSLGLKADRGGKNLKEIRLKNKTMLEWLK